MASLDQLYGIVLELGALWGVEGLGRAATLKISTRQLTGLGRCYPGRGLITLNQVLFAESNAGVLREVVCHEAAHLAVHLKGVRMSPPHGPEWKKLMHLAGFRARATIPAGQVEGLRRRGALYLHRCRHCGLTFRAARRDRRWRCAPCVGRGLAGLLEVISIAVEKVR